VTEPSASPTRSRFAVLKVAYLIAVTASAFAIPSIGATRPARWYVVSSLLLLQVGILLRCGIPLRSMSRSAFRLRWLFGILLVCYAFLPGDDRRAGDHWIRLALPFATGSVGVNLGGLALAALMCGQIMTVILASAVVRLTGPGTDFVDGLRAVRVPALFVHSLDQTLGQLGGLPRKGAGLGGGTGRGDGRGRHRQSGSDAPEPGAGSPGFFAIARRLLRGDVGFFLQSIRGNLERAQDQVIRDSQGRLDDRLAHDVGIITGCALVMVSLKMLKSLPGVPFASGHKTLLFYPLYILASRRTHTRWGGTTAGSVMGVIGFLQGDGRFGALDVLKHLAPGLLIDLLMPIVKRLPQSAWIYCGLGFLAAIARTATEFAVVALLGARAEVYVFAAGRLIPNLIAGTLSGLVTVYVLKAFPPVEPVGRTQPESSPPGSPSQPDLIAVHPAVGGSPRGKREEDE
jgi:hypothetical protein